MVQFVNQKMDEGDYVVCLLSDLTRSFHTVKHSFVTEKLDTLGNRGYLNKWFISYFQQKEFRVKIVSPLFATDIGIP